mmetsp:Transcript_7208/g.14147  ORF Transcript_7208/g.14147 Transcript_7208/m.14147 type:complete len:222 (-) Transcript_7208:311-976(-)
MAKGSAVRAALVGIAAFVCLSRFAMNHSYVSSSTGISAKPGARTFRNGMVARAGFGGLFGGAQAAATKYPVMGEESIMSQKEHGTTTKPVQMQLKYGCDRQTADRICSFNRHYAEHSGYFQTTKWLDQVDRTVETTYYDSVTGKPLFVAPRGRSFDEFLAESRSHGWPSFRDEEVVWENVRVLRDGEAVSVDGTHLGHNLPDGKGNRYCINLVSVAGNPAV